MAWHSAGSKPRQGAPSVTFTALAVVVVCGTLAAGRDFDCNAGYTKWEAGWSSEKKTWCCVNFDKACDPWHCSEGDPMMWPGAKQQYCCSNTGTLGCTTTSPMYDCRNGLQTWEERWTSEKKTWCCVHEQKACDAWNCAEGAVDRWPGAKANFCCQKIGQGCATSRRPTGHDCNAGYDNWERGWSDDKKGWCCDHAQKACEWFDCSRDQPSRWAEAKRGYCCKKTGAGCEVGGTNPNKPFDCDENFWNWEAWSRAKKTWCCDNEIKACDRWDCTVGDSATWTDEKRSFCSKSPPGKGYDCNEGFKNWEVGWTVEKKRWCCSKQQKACDDWDCMEGQSSNWCDAKRSFCCKKTGHRGCKGALPGTTRSSHDCNEGYEHWEVGWSSEKKKWCCSHEQKACDDWDCTEGLAPTWCNAKKSFCCKKTGQHCEDAPPGGAPSPSPQREDCSVGYEHWEVGWSTEKKQRCCDHEKKACHTWNCLEGDPPRWCDAKRDACCKRSGRGCFMTTKPPGFNCAEQLDRWEAAWPVEKKSWCCANEQKACERWHCAEGTPTNWPGAKRIFCCKSTGQGCRYTTSVVAYGTCDTDRRRNWEAAWSPKKKEWCCQNFQKACQAYRCDKGDPLRWKDVKKWYCCARTGQGCPPESLTTPPYDCDAGLDHWETGWSSGQKKYCCEAQGRACDEWNCAEGQPSAWCDTKRSFCCPRTRQGCPTTPKKKFDCSTGLQRWEQGWSIEKKNWCCENENRACGKFDCDAGRENWQAGWTASKRAWCCVRTEGSAGCGYGN